MKTPFVVMKDSAMGQSQKISILSNDLLRRLSNCSETVEMSEKVQIIDDYTETLSVSGYSKREIKEIIESGLTGFVRKVERLRKAGIPFHRPASMTLQGRIRKKLLEKTNWYKSKPKEKGGFDPRKRTSNQNGENKSLSEKEPPVSVMFCPQTPQGELAKRLREADKKLAEVTKDEVKIVERAGTKLRFLLHKSNPFDGGKIKCNRDKCLICDNPLNKKFNCGQRNVTYMTVCLKCEEDSKKSANKEQDDVPEDDNDVESEENAVAERQIVSKHYFGESHRSGGERQAEHAYDYRKKKKDSHMFKHLQEVHPGKEPEDIKFGMTIKRQHFTAFQRMVFEEILIFMAGDKTLNSKSMYNRCKIPRLSVMVGEDEEEPVRMTEYDTAELESEISKLRNQIRKADSADDPQASKRRKRWQFHPQSLVRYKGKRKRKKDHNDVVEEGPTDQETVESHSQKKHRPVSDPEDHEEESPDGDRKKKEEKPNRSLRLFSIFTKPIISFNSKPTVFNSNPEVKNPPKKIPAKAKKRSNKTTGRETKTNSKITNYFLGSTAAADETHLTQTKAPSGKIDFSDMAQSFADS